MTMVMNSFNDGLEEALDKITEFETVVRGKLEKMEEKCGKMELRYMLGVIGHRKKYRQRQNKAF